MAKKTGMRRFPDRSSMRGRSAFFASYWKVFRIRRLHGICRSQRAMSKPSCKACSRRPGSGHAANWCEWRWSTTKIKCKGCPKDTVSTPSDMGYLVCKHWSRKHLEPALATLVVIEHDPARLVMLAMILRALGYGVLEAGDEDE